MCIRDSDITVASEVMAILGLATSLKDLRERLGRITFGYSTSGKPLTADDIGAGGAMAVLLKDAIKLSDYVVTESGFGADLGSEKFMDIICRYGGFEPSCVVITCTMRALKMHGGLPVSDLEGLKAENNAALEKGCENLAKQVENMKLFGIPVVVTINRFAFDRDSEVEIVHREAIAAGAEDAVPINVHALGGDGAQEAAEIVKAAADKGGDFKFL